MMQEGAAPRARPRRFLALALALALAQKSLRADPWRGGELPNRRPSIRGLPLWAGSCPRSALCVPFVFPLCSLCVPLLFPFCSPSVPFLFPFCSHLLGGWEFHKGYRHVTDVYVAYQRVPLCNPATLRVDTDALRFFALPVHQK